MYKYDLVFLNTYNAAVSFSPDGKSIRENNDLLEKQSSSLYLKERKSLIYKYNDSFITELASDENYLYCYLSVKNYRILFNLIPLSSSPFPKEISNCSLETLEFVHNIPEENILGRYKTILQCGSPFEFRLINTCDAFLNYVKLNGAYPSRKINKDFLTSFLQSLEMEKIQNLASGAVNILRSSENNQGFKYAHFYDFIFILDYWKDTIQNS